MGKIRLLVAEDETIIRMGTVKLLEDHPEYSVAGEAADGAGLIEKYIKIKPDIVLCDLSMPVMNGLESSAKILEKDKSAKIILLTSRNEEEYICAAIRIGILGYISKSLEITDLKSAIESVHAGETYYPGKTKDEIEEIKSVCRSRNNERKLDGLTKREKEILYLLGEGLTNREISEKLYLSKRTIDNHRYSVMKKLGFSRRSEIVEFLIKIRKPLVYDY